MDILGTHKRRVFTYCLIGIVGFGLILTGCQTFKKESGLMQKMAQTGKASNISAQELRTQLNDMVGVFNGSIEQAASIVYTETKDPDIRRQALLWKINAIPAVNRSLFQHDPMIAFLDTWAFSFQMINYFENGPGKTDFGAWSNFALDVSILLEERVAELAMKIVGKEDISTPSEKVMAWARENPIKRGFIFRDTIVPVLSSVLKDQGMDTFQTVGALALGMDDLSFQLTNQMNLIPKQSRWQAQWMLENMVAQKQLESGLATMESIGKSVERISPIVEQGPEILSGERQKVLDTLTEERIASLEEIDRQRIATLVHLTRQRLAATEDLQKELALIREQVISERKIVLANLNDQRTVTLSALNETVDRMMVQSEQAMQGFMYRMFIFTAALLLGGVFLVIFLIRFVLMNRPSGN